eukprot:403351398
MKIASQEVQMKKKNTKNGLNFKGRLLCFATLTTTPVSDQTYTLGQGSFGIYYPFWSISNAACAPSIYTIKVDGGAAVAPYFTIVTSSRTIYVNTNRWQDAGVRTIRLTGTTTYGSNSNYLEFQVTIINPCDSLSVTPTGTLGDQNYYINSPADYYTVPPFTHPSVAITCQPITYVVVDSSGNTPDPVVTFNSGTMQIKVESSALYLLTAPAQYQVFVRAYLNPSNYYQYPVTIHFLIDCNYNVVNTLAASSSTYYVYNSAQTINNNIFTCIFDNYGCPQVSTYSCQFTNGTACPTALSVFQFDISTGSLTVDTSDELAVGPYSFTITGQTGDGLHIGTRSVNIIIACDCKCSDITSYPIGDVGVYDIMNSTANSHIIYTANWLSSMGGCGITYTFTDVDTGCLATNFVCSTQQMTINITDQCATAIITPNAPPDTVYITSDPTQTLPFTAWTSVPAFCIYYDYEIFLDDNSTVPAFATINNATRKLFVYTTDIAERGYRNVTLKGTLTQNNHNVIKFLVEIQVSCAQNILYPSAAGLLNHYQYNITKPTWYINFNEFGELTNGRCGPFTWTAWYNSSQNINLLTYMSFNATGDYGGGKTATVSFDLILLYICYVSNLSPNPVDIRQTPIKYRIGQGLIVINFQEFIDYEDCVFPIIYGYTNSVYLNGIVNGANVNSKYITVQCDDKYKALNPLHTLAVKSWVVNVNDTAYGQLNIPLQLVSVNNAAPKYVTPLQVLELTAGEAISYKFPDFFDIDSDNANVTKVDLTFASNIIQGKYPNFDIITSNDTLPTDYRLRIYVTDDNPYPLSKIYQLKIKVKPKKVQTNNFTTIIQDQSKISKELSARIQTINMDGLVNVRFNKGLRVPKEYWKIDNQTLKIEIFDENGAKRNLNFTWNVTAFNSKNMQIQLIFDDPSLVSKFLKITFIANAFFVESYTGLALKVNYVVQKRIPRQLRNDGIINQQSLQYIEATKILKSIGGTVATIFSTMISASLQFVWGLVNVVQLIVHMPLLNLDFPSNEIFFYSLLMDMSTLDILPTDSVEDKVFVFSEDADAYDNFQLMDIF